jgi:hypothetical protein
MDISALNVKPSVRRAKFQHGICHIYRRKSPLFPVILKDIVTPPGKQSREAQKEVKTVLIYGRVTGEDALVAQQ